MGEGERRKRKMPPLNQLREKKIKKKKKKKLGVLKGNPFRKGICLKVYEMKPKKPNSARRKVCKVSIIEKSKDGRVGKKEKGIVFIPGEGHNLEEYGRILIRGG